MPTKLIVTAEAAMKKRYGKGWAIVRKAIDTLVGADAGWGVTTSFVALDEPSLGQWQARTKPESFKNAIDHVAAHHQHPDYILILGGPDIVPHQRLRNPVPDDDDADVPSDLPYACDRPAGDDVAGFIAPSRVVGRVPSVPGDRSPKLLVSLIESAARWKPKAKAAYQSYFGLSAHVWRRSTTLSLKALFGSAATTRTSPADGPGWSKGDLAPLSHFINCHGATIDPQFYGQKDNDFPVAEEAVRLPGKVARGTVVAAECCYGAELYDPKGTTVPSIATHYLREGALGFMGSTNTAYGPATTNGAADLLCRFFLESMMTGASLGRALLEARLRFVREASPLSPIELKTLGQFLLLGDPSVRPVASQPQAGAKSFARAMSAHVLGRARLTSTAVTLAKGVDSVASAADGPSPAPVRAHLEKAAQEEGFVPLNGAQSYDVRKAQDPASRAEVTKKAFTSTRYHVMVTRRPQPAKTEPGARGAKGKKILRRPPGIDDRLLLVAREVGGKVEAVERLYAHLRSTAPNERFLRRPSGEEAGKPGFKERPSGRGARNRRG